ncbi:MAG: DNA internalization-related competence protein ComEC/Rec2 [Acidaminococcaceae bacterium]|nr:DNA internalization-related competence protein ComEC/Rec2 [Acidaminococcaceae bacterium]
MGALWCALSFCLGDYLSLCYREAAHAFWPVFVLALALALYVCLRFRDKSLETLLGAALLLFFLCGTFVGSAAALRELEGLRQFVGREVIAGGDIVPGTIKKIRDGTFAMYLDCGYVRQDNLTLPAQGLLRLVISGVPPEARFIKAGGSLLVRGKLKPVRGFANPGVFDSEQAARAGGIAGSMSIKAVDARYRPAKKTWRHALAACSAQMRSRLFDAMPARDAAILAGMTLGGYEGIDEETVRDFSRTGIVHILSVSGSHIALLVGFMLFLGKSARVGRRITLAASAFTIVSYALLCGFAPPVWRSTLMGLAMLGGRWFDRREDRGAVLSFTAVAMLCYNPLWLLDVGFQLSFVCTAGLICLVPRLEELLSAKIGNTLAAGLAVTIGAQLPALPLLVHYFHRISVSSLLANLVIVPIVEAIVLLTMLGLFLGLVFRPVGTVFLLSASLALSPALLLTGLLAAWPAGCITVPAVPGAFALSYFLLLFNLFALAPFNNWQKRQRLAVVLACCLSLAAPFVSRHFAGQAFTAYFIDVGQGDAALVVTPEKKTILIDAGGLPGNYDTGERIIVPFLRYLGIDRLDVLIISHGHHDHAGGAAAVARSVPIDCLLLPPQDESEDIARLLQEAGQSRCEFIKSGQRHKLGRAVITVLAAPTGVPGSAYGGGNERSAIIKVEEGGRSFVFTGDATAEEELLAVSEEVRTDVLKVSHHGSKTSSGEEFLHAAAPRLTVISVGADNRFGHPAPETLEKLQGIGARIARTDRDGNVKVVFDGLNCACYSYRCQKEYF